MPLREPSARRPAENRLIAHGDYHSPSFDLRREWLSAARIANLGALCELLTRPDVPDNVVAEIRDLILATVDRLEA